MADYPLVFDTTAFGGREIAHRADGATVTQVTDDAAYESWFPRLSPDGSTILFVRVPPGSHDPPDYSATSLWACAADGSGLVQIVDQSAEGWDFLATPHWSPDGTQLVIARAATGTAARPTACAPDGTVVADVDFDAGAALTDPSWHPDPDIGGAGIARVVYCRAGSLVRRDWDGTAPSGARTTVFDATAWDPESGANGRVTCYDPAYSTDGTKVLFLADFEGYAAVDVLSDFGIAVCDADGTDPLRVTPDDFDYGTATWSPDGLWVYCYRFNGNWELVRVPADGTAVATPGLVEVLYDAGFYSEYPDPYAADPPEPELPCEGAALVYHDTFARAFSDLAGSDTDGAGTGDPEMWVAIGDVLRVDAGAVRWPAAPFDAPLGVRLASLPLAALDVALSAPVTLDAAENAGILLAARLVAYGTDFAQLSVDAQDGSLILGVARPGPLTDSDTAAAGTVVTGDVVTFRCLGPTIDALVNGTVVATVTDPTPTVGDVAIGLATAFTDFSAGSVTAIDEVWVYTCTPAECPCGDDFEREDGPVANGWTDLTAAPWEIVDGEAGVAPIDGLYPGGKSTLARDCGELDVELTVEYGALGDSALFGYVRGTLADVPDDDWPAGLFAGIAGGVAVILSSAGGGAEPVQLVICEGVADPAEGDVLGVVVVGDCIAVSLNGDDVCCFAGAEVSAQTGTAAGVLSSSGGGVDPPTRVEAICVEAAAECACPEPLPPPGPAASLGGPCGEPPRVLTPSGPLGPASPCAQVRAGIWRRGQRGVWLWLDSGARQIDAYEWGRARSEVSTAKLGIPLGGTVDSACCDRLAAVEPWECEVRLFRDDAEVWRGPIMTCDETAGRVELVARDVAAWLDRRRIHRRHAFVDYDAARAWERLAGDALSGAWPDGVRLSVSDACARVTRTIEPLPHLIAGKPMSELADGAVDWTALGPLLVAGGLCTNVIVSGTLYDDAFSGPLHLVKDGLAYAEHVYVNGESDIVGDAGDPSPHVELVLDDQGARDERTARIHAQQAWAVRGREGVPRIISTSAGVALSPRAPVGINDLIPGRMFRLSIRPACTPLVALMRLVTLTVTGDAEGEQVVPAFEPIGDAGGRNEAS